jgi:hypothetical protein
MSTHLPDSFARVDRESDIPPAEPTTAAVLLALAVALVLVFATRWPVARAAPLESDEFGFLERISEPWFPMHHTLFLTGGRLIGAAVGDPYRGLVVLDMLMSALALLSLWWWLRAVVSPRAAAAGACLLGAAPVFWGYGAMAGNYTAIVAVGSFLLGIACRSRSRPSPWQPYAASVVLAIGTGYREDLGTFWLPVFLVILWLHRWRRALLAGILFAMLNLAWLGPMLYEAGGWTRYRAASAEFAYQAGYLNSVWSLGLVDAPLRYSVKLGMTLLWTLGPALLVVPRGYLRLRRIEGSSFLSGVLALSMAPALASHLLVHFGVPGYAFHYIPALLALAAIGAGSLGAARETGPLRTAPARLALAASLMAGLFLLYPTDYECPGWRGSFDLSFARHTRIGLRLPLPNHQPSLWRTANSRVAQGNGLNQHRGVGRPL